MAPLVLISGCSGGGKSTLLEELRRRGYHVVPEPGRRIVAEERASGGRALPWVDEAAFARRALVMAQNDFRAAQSQAGTVFFDRGIVDAASGIEHLTGEPCLEAAGRAQRYHATVFLAPPWPEIFVGDEDRRHGFDIAVAEYERLLLAFDALDYRAVPLPRMSVGKRADFVLAEVHGTP